MAHNKGKILVVDDDRLVLATLAHGLSRAGYDVIDADNGDDAILLAREQRPDLALLDIRMQGKSGFDVAAYLRDHLQISFMFLSAFADEETVAQVRALGAVAYLVKPLDISQILPAVETALAQVRSRGPAATPAVVIGGPAVGAAPTAPADPLVWMAVGLLMQRHLLPRAAALEQLDRLARGLGQTLADRAQQLVEAFEAEIAGRRGTPVAPP